MRSSTKDHTFRSLRSLGMLVISLTVNRLPLTGTREQNTEEKGMTENREIDGRKSSKDGRGTNGTSLNNNGTGLSNDGGD